MTIRLGSVNRRRSLVLCRLILFSLGGLAGGGLAWGQVRNGEVPKETQAKLDVIEKRMAELQESGQKSEAAELGKKHAQLLDWIRGRAPLPKSDREFELHMVGVYEGRADTDQTATVSVTYAEKPVILALCAYDPVWWTIQVGPGVKIEKIILGGYHHQEIEKMPAGIEVEKHVYVNGDSNGFHAYRLQDDSYPDAIRKVKQLTGQTPVTFIGAYRPPTEPLVVGESNPDWRLQRVFGLVDELYETATAARRQRIAATLEKVTFRAIYADPTDRYGRARAVGTFKVAGPLSDTLKSIRPALTQLAVDPETSNAYGVTMHALFRVDLFTGETTELKLASRKDLPPFSWTAGVAFDAKRRRLLVMTSHVYSRIYAYEVDTDQWSLLATSRGESFGSVAYDAKRDVICMTGREGSSSECTTLHKFTPDGQHLDAIELSQPIRGGRESLGRTQLIPLTEDLLAIVPGPVREADVNGSPAVLRTYVVDSNTGEIVDSTIQSIQRH